MAGKITAQGIQRAATRLGVEAAHIKAVLSVESAGKGFHDDGRPVILFEAHVFSRETDGFYDAKFPLLSTRSRVPSLYRGGLAEWPRFYQALQLDADAAQKACSWGLFQIMGFNWAACGERSLAGFVHAMYHDEDTHLALFCNFLETQGLTAALRAGDWVAFARRYNGAGFAANRYDTKLAEAYARARNGR